MSEPAPDRPALVVPVKAFAAAKARLAGALDPARRATMARVLADGVVDAAGDRAVVIACDDDEVRDWAVARGVEVVWTPGRDLSGAATAAVEVLAGLGVPRVAVAHADLPFPARLAPVIDGSPAGSVLVVGDRDRDGTNVIVVPTRRGFRFAYGPGSFARHVREAERLGIEVVVVDEPGLAWDLDDPDDLRPPAELGTPTWERAGD